MTVVRTIPRKSRLSSLIDTSGGVSVGVARRQANANLEAMKERSQALISERLTGMLSQTLPGSFAPAEERPLATLSPIVGLGLALIAIGRTRSNSASIAGRRDRLMGIASRRTLDAVARPPSAIIMPPASDATDMMLLKDCCACCWPACHCDIWFW